MVEKGEVNVGLLLTSSEVLLCFVKTVRRLVFDPLWRRPLALNIERDSESKLRLPVRPSMERHSDAKLLLTERLSGACACSPVTCVFESAICKIGAVSWIIAELSLGVDLWGIALDRCRPGIKSNTHGGSLIKGGGPRVDSIIHELSFSVVF